jgi:arsenite methyltransferase
MQTATDIKDMVRSKYGEIAAQSKEQNAASCCGAGECSTVDYTIFSEDYTKLKGYVADADLALGCGVPTEFAQIREGNVRGHDSANDRQGS